MYQVRTCVLCKDTMNLERAYLPWARIHKRDQTKNKAKNQLKFTPVYTKLELSFWLNLILIPFVNMGPE